MFADSSSGVPARGQFHGELAESVGLHTRDWRDALFLCAA
jgi:hypothetical protein